MITLWRLCDEVNRYRWRAVLAFIAILICAPVLLLWRKYR